MGKRQSTVGLIVAAACLLGSHVSFAQLLHSVPPPIAGDFFKTWSAKPVAASPDISESQAWSNALNKRFPAGTYEQDILATLKQEGFSMAKESPHEAWYFWGNTCRAAIDASWQPDSNGRVMKIDGLFEYRCI